MIHINEIKGAEILDVEDLGTVNVQLPVGVVHAALEYANALDVMGEKVKAIKFLRWQFKVGLKEAHRIVQSLSRDRRRQKEQERQKELQRDVVVCDYCGWEGDDIGAERCPACACSFGSTFSVPDLAEGE